MWTCAGVLFLATCACAITRDQFYPHGAGLDQELPRGHEVATPEIPLNVPVIFYGEQYDSIYVNNYGVLSFRSDIPSFLNAEFPLPYPSIAAFYTNVDTTLTGTVYYRETNDTRVTMKAAETVQENFGSFYEFQPKSVFIATWVGVTYSTKKVEKTNTFQIAIISNGNESFVELLYPEREIQWIQGEITNSGFPDAKAQAGFVAEDGRMYSLRGSGSHQIRNVISWTNTHEPGKYIFRVGNITPDGNVAAPDQYNQNEIEYEEESKTCAQSGPSICHTQARCVDYQAGICCQCNDGYYGNGKTCIKEDVPLRVHGRLFGEVNGVSLNDVNIQAYVVVADGRSYTALSQGPRSIGGSLQTLNILGGVIGWLFAKPISNAKNGYQLTGSVFNHTAEIFYPNTGDRVTIRQEYMGHDVFDQITLESDIRGTVPVVGHDEKLDLKEYEEQYSIVDNGLVRSQSTRIFINKMTNVQYEQRITQTISFNTCRFAPTNDEDKVPFTLQVGKNYLNYETKENIVRYGMSNKIVPIGHEDPCVRGRTTCGPSSVCVVNGESYKCICNDGFTNTYQSDGETCVDIDECSAGTHNCDSNADCFNYEGGFTCRCKQGYDGDGVICAAQRTGCSTIRCDPNAQCIEDGETAQCVCSNGYSGDGNRCWPNREATTCDVLHNCSPYATCAYSYSANSYICQCSVGYTGDGYHCAEYLTTTPVYEPEYNDTYLLPECTEYGCVCPPGYTNYDDERGNNLCQKANNLIDQTEINNNGIKCSSNYTCPPNAECLFSESSDGYECQCLPGYESDGFECVEKSSCSDCGNNAHCVITHAEANVCMCDVGYHGDGYLCRPNLGCVNNSDCEYNAECRYDPSSGEYVCQCIDGYTKDQNDACIKAGELCNGAICADHASCLWDDALRINYCHCDQGYDGVPVEKCVEVGNTCDITNDCNIDGICMRVEDSYQCVCKEGFIGNGYSCAPEPNCRNIPNLCDSHASCLSQNGAYVCECIAGYYGNGSYCQPNPRQPGNFLIASSGIFIYKVPFQSNNREYATPINTAQDQIAVGMDVDCQSGRIYWGDVVSNTIKTAAYDGSSFDHFLYTDVKAEGIAVDWVSRNIYWTDSKKISIEVANLDTKIKHVLFSRDGIANPRGIAVHPQRGKLFWSDWNRNGPKIEWANMDGSGRGVFLTSPDLQLPNSLAIDWNNERLCYSDAGLKTIECVDIDSRRRETIASNCSYPFGLAIKDEIFYWTDWKTSKIEYIDTRTQARGVLSLAIPSGRLYGVAVALDQCPDASNVCQYRSGNCDYNQLCLPDGRNGRTCL